MKNSMLFRKIGGSRQLVLDKAENLEQIPQLDEAYWAVNAMPLEAAVTDPEFLSFLDAVVGVAASLHRRTEWSKH